MADDNQGTRERQHDAAPGQKAQTLAHENRRKKGRDGRTGRSNQGTVCNRRDAKARKLHDIVEANARRAHEDKPQKAVARRQQLLPAIDGKRQKRCTDEIIPHGRDGHRRPDGHKPLDAERLNAPNNRGCREQEICLSFGCFVHILPSFLLKWDFQSCRLRYSMPVTR